MKTLIISLIFFSLPFSNSYKFNCTDWEAYGENPKLSIRFCNLSEPNSEYFEIKNDLNQDAKLTCTINFKNGKKITNVAIIPLDDKVRFYFRDFTTNRENEIASWKFDKVEFKNHGGFKN